MLAQSDFVAWFRSAAPYIRGFSGQTFVIAVGGEVVEDGNFVELTHDLNLLASVGVRIVLVHGARPQIEQALKSQKLRQVYSDGVRVTDEDALSAVKAANGRLRLEIEALLSMGLPNTPLAGSHLRVTSGNFVIAKPMGVVDGVDMLYTGVVRRIRVNAIQKHLDGGELVLVSPIGYSPTGEIFNLTHEDVASNIAISLQAQKLIFLADTSGLKDVKGQLVREITTGNATKLLSKNLKANSKLERQVAHQSIHACENGVERAHLIDRTIDGAVLLELFTREGIGTMISVDSLDEVRKASVDDIGGILQLIEPLEKKGILVRRSRELLEIEINRFIVMEHDGFLVGCAALYPFSGAKAGELACLAVHASFQNSGVGETLLREIEKEAKRKKLSQLFVLTTATSHWFIENGFRKSAVSTLPKKKADLYNYNRNSQVFVKKL
jgi:amino-acid N-acetyltransferase